MSFRKKFWPLGENKGFGPEGNVPSVNLRRFCSTLSPEIAGRALNFLTETAETNQVLVSQMLR